jgi:hypothetical protein
MDTRIAAFTVVSTIVLFGTLYSVSFNTYLDTSNPLVSHLPHPLQNSDYFANKSNVLNVYFIKKAWGWTSASFLVLWLTSPINVRTKERVFKWLTATTTWLVFTGWFFGPAVFERLVLASGGECVLHSPDGNVITVPNEYCFTSSVLSPVTHPNLFTTPPLNPEWHAIPKMRRGHDVSGHIFLLTMSVLFLADQLRPSFYIPTHNWSSWHRWAIWANLGLIVIWLLGCYTTSVYFHSPWEKLSGYRELLFCCFFAVKSQ